MSRKHDILQQLLATVGDVTVLQKLANALPFLSESETAIVIYILEQPADAVRMSASELAAATNTSTATLFRLCKQLDLSGYAELREAVKTAMQRLGPGFVSLTQATEVNRANMDPLQTGVYVGMRSLLDATSASITALHDSATALCNGQRIHICGMGPISGRLAELTAVSLQRLGLACMLWTDVQTLQKQSIRFGSDDVILALSHSGGNDALADFLQRAKAESAVIVAICNYDRSVVAQAADIRLITYTREEMVQNFDLLPRLPQLMLVQVLTNLVNEQLQRQRPAVDGG